MHTSNLVVFGFFSSPIGGLWSLIGLVILVGPWVILVRACLRGRMNQKSVGQNMIAWGVFGILYALLMDTSVGGFVNLSLMGGQRNMLDLSALAVLGGIILYGFGVVTEGRSSSVANDSTGPRCPKCNGELEGTPELCKHCRSELRWNEGRAFTVEQAAALSPLWEERRREQIEQRHLRERAWREAGRKWRDRWQRIRGAVAAVLVKKPSKPPPLPSRPPPLPSKPPPPTQSTVVPTQDGDSAPRPPSDESERDNNQ